MYTARQKIIDWVWGIILMTLFIAGNGISFYIVIITKGTLSDKEIVFVAALWLLGNFFIFCLSLIPIYKIFPVEASNKKPTRG